jgi:hypothetical protein
VAFAAGLDLREGALGDGRAEQIVEHQRPVLPACDRHLHPHHQPAGGAGRAREPIDVRHDLARGRDLDRRALGAKYILHVDYDQRGFVRRDRFEPMQTAAAKYDAVDHMGR